MACVACRLGSNDRMRWWLKLVAGAALAGVAVALVAAFVPVKLYLAASMAWIERNPAWGALALPLILCVGIPLCVPSPLFEMLAGSVFGIWYGGLLSVAGKTGGSLLAFALGKRFGRDHLHAYMETRFPSFATVLAILRHANWKLLVLLQLANVPHSAKCYGLAIADVSTFRFTVSTVVGAAPYAVLWAYLGFQSKQMMLGEASEAVVVLSAASTKQQTLLGVSGALFTAVSMVWLVVYTRRQFREEVAKHQQRLKSRNDSGETDDVWLDIFEEEEQEEADVEDASRPLTAKPGRSASCSCSSVKQRYIITV